MTETISHGIIGDTGPANEPLSIGRPAVEYEISIRHDDGSVNVPGQVGELVVRGMPGVSLFKEYLNDPDATSRSFDDDGWFHTGDNVFVSENGGVFWVDRGKDMLKVGGENVAAFEVESVIATVPGVAESAVVGKPDDLLDEVPVVFVIPLDPKADGAALGTAVVEACKKTLATFKVPREVYLVSELPRSTLEKVAKPELRRQVEEQTVVNVVPA
jgi:crotonobetaine/carnitine-CoA ligase